MEVRARVDQLPKDRVGAPQELPRRRIGDRGAPLTRPTDLPVLRSFGSKNARHGVRL